MSLTLNPLSVVEGSITENFFSNTLFLSILPLAYVVGRPISIYQSSMSMHLISFPIPFIQASICPNHSTSAVSLSFQVNFTCIFPSGASIWRLFSFTANHLFSRHFCHFYPIWFWRGLVIEGTKLEAQFY